MDSWNAGTALYCWSGPVPVGSYAQDEPVLVLPGWLGPREHGQIEQVTGGRVMKIGGGWVLVSRADPGSGWQDMGYADIELVDRTGDFQQAVDQVESWGSGMSVLELLQTRKYPVQFYAPAGWIDRWSRHMLNGPAALTGEGWRSGPVRWSERAIRRLADTYPHGWQRSRVLFNWAANPDLQGRKMVHHRVPADLLVNEGFEDVLARSLRGLGGGRGV